MKSLSVFLVLAGVTISMGGCGPSQQDQDFKKIEHDMRETEWKSQLVIEINEAETRMWQCTTEIYATKKSGGPVCQDACAKYKAFIYKEKNPPDYVMMPPGLNIPDPPSERVCKP